MKLQSLIKEEKTINPKQIKPGNIYLTKVEDIFNGNGKFVEGKELCVFKTPLEAHFFLVDEYPNYSKSNMKKILNLTPKQYVDGQGYEIDEEIYDNIVVNWIKNGKLEAEDGSEVVILKQIGKI